MLQLYTDATPNGLKISIGLEEMAFDYQVHQVFLGGEQFSAQFSELNPNRKIPVLVDGSFVLTESAAILTYLAGKSGKLMPSNSTDQTRVTEMLAFQMSTLGPMFGQYLVFAAAWGNKFPEVTQRYFSEVSRILEVMDKRLQGNLYLVGDEFTIADIAFIPWIRLCVVHPIAADLPFSQHKNLVAWWDRVSTRPAVIRGLANPEPLCDEKQFEAFVSATIGLGELHQQA